MPVHVFRLNSSTLLLNVTWLFSLPGAPYCIVCRIPSYDDCSSNFIPFVSVPLYADSSCYSYYDSTVLGGLFFSHCSYCCATLLLRFQPLPPIYHPIPAPLPNVTAYPDCIIPSSAFCSLNLRLLHASIWCHGWLFAFVPTRLYAHFPHLPRGLFYSTLLRFLLVCFLRCLRWFDIQPRKLRDDHYSGSSIILYSLLPPPDSTNIWIIKTRCHIWYFTTPVIIRALLFRLLFYLLLLLCRCVAIINAFCYLLRLLLQYIIPFCDAVIHAFCSIVLHFILFDLSHCSDIVSLIVHFLAVPDFH